MCGVFASIGFEPERARIDIVAHRGPDGDGWAVHASACGPVALGHRRLAIIDTSTDGLQPFSDPAGRYHLVYNGEIYNFREIRDELVTLNIQFRTKTDTEVLLQALIQWGEGALSRLCGMFAFILHDRTEHLVFAARDRFGIKPLYYVQHGPRIAFASEIKQLIGIVGLPTGINRARVTDFLLDGISDHTAETMFDGIRQLRGGEWAKVNLSPGQTGVAPHCEIGRWYDAAPPLILPRSPGEAAEIFGHLLRQSVRQHLIADVTVGSCLSGGLDSSSIVCLMAGLRSDSQAMLSTVTACYAEKAVDERAFAEMVADRAGANGHYIYPRPEDVFQSASDLTWHQDEPFGSTSIFAQWSVFAAARDAGVKVMLDGQGADEQLAGYHGLFGQRMRQLLQGLRLIEATRTQWQRHIWHGAPLVPPWKRAARALIGRNPRPALPDWLARGSIPAARVDAATTAAGELGLGPPNSIEAMCNLMIHGSNLPMLLHWEDRNSMAYGIEARVPFLDHRLVEFSLSLPADNKFADGDTKRVLRDAMDGILPEPVRLRRDKLGFATPEEIWLRGPLRREARAGIETTLRRFPDLFDASATRRLADNILDGKAPFSFQLWRLISLGLWGERFGL